MKNKIAQFALLGVFGLLLLAPSAMPFGKRGTAGLNVSASCIEGAQELVPGAADSCDVTITGLAAGKSYQLEVVNNCAGVPFFFPVNTTGTTYTGTISVPESGNDTCTANWTFHLLTPSGRELASNVISVP